MRLCTTDDTLCLLFTFDRLHRISSIARVISMELLKRFLFLKKLLHNTKRNNKTLIILK